MPARTTLELVEGIEFNEGEQLLSPMCPPNRGQHRYPASRERADGRVPPRVAVLSFLCSAVEESQGWAVDHYVRER